MSEFSKRDKVGGRKAEAEEARVDPFLSLLPSFLSSEFELRERQSADGWMNE